MSNVNICAISGNLTRDAILAQAGESGTGVLRFSVAVNEGFKNKKTGEWDERANFFDCVKFAKSPAELEGLASRLAKGAKVSVSGRLRWSQYQADDGGKRSKVEIVAAQVDLMPKAAGNAEGGEALAAPALYDEDIPF